jgi:hypothetical protein
MVTKIVGSRFNKNIGDTVEGHMIIEKTVIAQPVKSFDPARSRDGIYDYLVEVAPTVVNDENPKRNRFYTCDAGRNGRACDPPDQELACRGRVTAV